MKLDKGNKGPKSVYGKRVGAQGESKRKLIMDLEIDDRHNPILIKSNQDTME